MWALLFSLPVLISAPFFVMFNEMWWYVAIPLVILEAILVLIWHFSTSSVEFLGGYPIKVIHYNAWTELVVKSRTKYMDGEFVEVEETEEINHPDKYTWVLNTGKKQVIDRDDFEKLSSNWGGHYFVDKYHKNCIYGGGMEVSEWDGEEDSTWSVTYKNRYRNHLKQSNSLFKTRRHYSDYEAEMNGLFIYPEIIRHYQRIIIYRGDDAASKHYNVEAESELQKINAFEGYRHEIHVFILLYDSNKYGKEVSFKQRDYWDGLNKNELVICIGTDDKKARWCNAMSWSDSIEWLHSLEKKVLSMDELDLYEFSKWLRMNLDGWVRKEFKDFSYLKW